jgi:hypothetical protein
VKGLGAGRSLSPVWAGQTPFKHSLESDLCLKQTSFKSLISLHFSLSLSLIKQQNRDIWEEPKKGELSAFIRGKTKAKDLNPL